MYDDYTGYHDPDLETDFYAIVSRPSGWPDFKAECAAYREQMAAITKEARKAARRVTGEGTQS